MFCLTIASTALLSAILLWPVPSARADVEGPACVIDGNTLAINGKRSHRRCVGGVKVRLYGIVAPGLDQMCGAQGGRKWYCGRASATILLEAVKNKTLVCKGRTKDNKNRLMAICFLDGEDLNRKLVRNGWALAYLRYTAKYEEDEKLAMWNRKGLWQASTGAVFEWRDR